MQAHKVKPVGKMDVDVEVQADVDEEQELLDERRVKQESGAKKKLKEWWRLALCRRLEVEWKELGHWAINDNFTQLLNKLSDDNKLEEHIKSLFPDNPLERQSAVLSNKELSQYLNTEMNNFYLLMK